MIHCGSGAAIQKSTRSSLSFLALLSGSPHWLSRFFLVAARQHGNSSTDTYQSMRMNYGTTRVCVFGTHRSINSRAFSRLYRLLRAQAPICICNSTNPSIPTPDSITSRWHRPPTAKHDTKKLDEISLSGVVYPPDSQRFLAREIKSTNVIHLRGSGDKLSKLDSAVEALPRDLLEF